jgi:hypothetical protein
MYGQLSIQVYRYFVEAWRDVLPYVLNLLPNETSDNQMLATESLVKLLETRRQHLSQE